MNITIQLFYILDCPWWVTTKELIKKVIDELQIEAKIEEILIDSDDKAKNYGFAGSPTILVNGQDIEELVKKVPYLPGEQRAKERDLPEFIHRECSSGCRLYHYQGKIYLYPPIEMVEEAILNIKEQSIPT